MTLLQRLWRDFTSKKAFTNQPGLISPGYAQLNAQLHLSQPSFGVSGRRWAGVVADLAHSIQAKSILDYGCGKQTLADALPDHPIRGYDPAIETLSAPPEPADLVVCTDVLEHVEPECIDNVLDHLMQLCNKAALISVATRPATKILADGRNAHLIIESLEWWQERFDRRFQTVIAVQVAQSEFIHVLKALDFDGDVPKPNAKSLITK